MFLNVVAFNDRLSERALFHALVHTVQIEVLWPEALRGIVGARVREDAGTFHGAAGSPRFSLASRYLRPGVEAFSVDEVLRWAADLRY